MLNINEIRKFTVGAARIYEEDGSVRFSRFTEKQCKIIVERGFSFKRFSNSCIRLEFYTRGGEVSFDFVAVLGTGRRYFSLDLTVDGWLVKHDMYGDDFEKPLSFKYDIPACEEPCRVVLYLPNMAGIHMKNLCIPEDAVPVEKKCRIYMPGDSITQGFDAFHNNLSLANIIADHYDAEMINHGIGGEVFCADNLDENLDFKPDFIVTGYGTNDWGARKLGDGSGVDAYFTKLEEIYKGVPIFMLLPIWRADGFEERNGISFENARKLLAEVGSRHSAVTVIDCYKFIPALTEFFFDERLHPNDNGFMFYGGAVCRAIDKELAQKSVK